MYYFLTHTINDKLAGLEIAMINRLKIFREMDVPAKIVTFHFNRQLHENMKHWSIPESDMLSMFDFFQNAVSLPTDFEMQNDVEQITTRLIEEHDVELDVQANDRAISFLDRQRQLKARINRNGNLATSIEWFDRNSNLVRRDGFDTRGFLSIATFFGQDGGVAHEVMYDITGNEVINSYYHEQANGEIGNTLLILKQNNVEMMFSDLDHLAAYFYDQISIVNGEQATFIADRSYLVDKPLFLMKNTVKKYEFWHNTFTTDYSPEGPLVPVMENEISSGQLNGYLVPTRAAAVDLEKRLPESIPVHNIPVALNDEMPTVLSFEQRDPDKIILVARIEEQKNISDALKAFKIMRDQRSTLKLYVYGYILDIKLNERLQEQVRDLGLEGSVIFKAYTLSKDEIYQNAQLLLLTSRNEGWGMVINEAFTYGVPVVSYDTKYGPSEVVTDNQDGYIVEQGDYQAMASKSLELLADDEKRADFARFGVDAMRAFDLKASAERWKALLEKI